MIFTGFKFAAVPNWDVIMPINAPSNYKKQEAIDKYIAERKAKLAGGEAASDRLVGQVVQVAYKYDDEEKLYEGDTVLRLFNTLMEKNEQGVPIVGYKIHRALKLLALANATSTRDSSTRSACCSARPTSISTPSPCGAA